MNNCVSTFAFVGLGLVLGLFLFSAEWAGGRGQGKAVGMSLSCRTQVRRAEVCASEEEKAPNSSEAVLVPLGDGALKRGCQAVPS